MKGAPVGAAITTTKKRCDTQGFSAGAVGNVICHGRCGDVPSGQKLLLSGHDQLTANPIRIPFDR